MNKHVGGGGDRREDDGAQGREGKADGSDDRGEEEREPESGGCGPAVDGVCSA